MKNIKKVHIAIIICGVIFILLGAFHTNIWFDEAYTVAIVNHSFSEIWTIGGNDVHPILYYWMLKILNLIFGANILVYRLFSAVPIIILAVLGFTHIRKDFGEKEGAIFSFLTLFLPVMGRYAIEIRMYSWAMLFISIEAIYAYRLWRKEFSNKNLVIFAIFSLFGAYTHYYGLMASGIINLILFVYLIKNFKNKKREFIKFMVSACLQVALYIPWLMYFLTQIGNVSSGFWITIKFPDTYIELLNMQFRTNLEPYFAFAFAVLLYTDLGYLVYKEKKAKKDIKPAIIGLGIYVGVIIAARIISEIMHSAILLDRYLLVVTGLLMFFISFFLAKEERSFIVIKICTFILIMSIVNNIIIIKDNYAESNNELNEFMVENIKEDDLILYNNEFSGFVLSAKYKDNKQYFYNQDGWNVEEAYKAFGPNMEIIYDLDKLSEYSGRIWVAYSNNNTMLEEMKEKYKVDEKNQYSFDTAYNGYQYKFVLIEK